jgi:hypothetical protein
MNEPIIGATIVVKGNSQVGVITDIDGKFKINVPPPHKTMLFRTLA